MAHHNKGASCTPKNESIHTSEITTGNSGLLPDLGIQIKAIFRHAKMHNLKICIQAQFPASVSVRALLVSHRKKVTPQC